jgi:Rha family phage regulatory protein
MTDFSVFQHEDGALVVDSRLVAQRLGIKHENFMETVKKYKTQTEQAFGQFRFETGTVSNSVGAVNETRFVFLTEDQATFLMTLSRNSPEVVQCKLELVKQFSEAKRLLKQKGFVLLAHTSIYIRRIENIRDHIIDDDLWMIFREANEILLMVEKDYRVPVEQMDLCDGSIGKHWANYRKGKPWAVLEEKFYTHDFRDQRGKRQCKAFDYSEIKYFKRWLKEEYIPIHLPTYLIKKYGKRAVRLIYEELGQLNEYIIELTDENRLTATQNELYEIFLAAREALNNRLYLE